MSDDLSTKCALVVDNGLFAEIAPRLARDFGHVYYFMPWLSAYPKAAPAHVGSGLPGVARVESFWDYVPDADIVVFPDIYYADAQRVIRERFHKPVWGHGDAERLELDRRGTRRFQRATGIPGPRTRYFTGLDALADFLEDPKNENKWVKISAYRGDGETWHHETWHTTSVYLDHFANRVGALASGYEFLVEDAIDDAVEIGYDGWQVRGQFPEAAYYGFEVKDAGYVGRFRPYAEMPQGVREVNDQFSAPLTDAGGCGFCSFEFRLTRDGTPHVIDPCMRAGSPPFEAVQEGYDNLSEIIWEGAHGRLASPRPLGEYVALAIIHSPFALTNWVPVECPEEDRRWLKLRNVAIVDGELYHVPCGGEMPEIGAVVAAADTMEEAIELVKERAGRVKGFLLDIKVDSLDAAQEEIEKAKEFGVDF